MSYTIPYKIEAKDVWKLTMKSMYKTMAGLINVLFTVSILALAITFWSNLQLLLRLVLVLGIALFTVIQPLSIYWKSKQMTDRIPSNSHVLLNEKGIHITLGENSTLYNWRSIRNIVEEKHLCIVRTTKNQGLYLKYENMGSQKEQILDYIKNHLKEV